MTPHPEALVFTTAEGNLGHRAKGHRAEGEGPSRKSGRHARAIQHSARRHFAPLVIRAGLYREVVSMRGGKCQKVAAVTYHALRHTAATLLLSSGADVKTAQAVLGACQGEHDA